MAKIGLILMAVVVTTVSLITAYIIFAPDNMPKPFRLMYDYTTPTPMVEEVAVEATEAPEEHKLEPGEGVMVNMSTKIINLADPSGRKYIRTTMVFEFAPENPEYLEMPEEEKVEYLTEFSNEVNARMPVMDDTVITLLSTKTFDDLYTAEGKERLRLEIMQAVANKLPDLHLMSVYFTEFVVQ